MASTARQFKGWQYYFDVESQNQDTPRRRSRRNDTLNDRLTLKRNSDGLEIEIGTVVEVQNSKYRDFALIHDISFGTDVYLEVKAMWFLRAANLSSRLEGRQVEKNELFLTPVTDRIKLKDILRKVKVISKSEYEAIGIDDSNINDLFLCRYCCDHDGSNITDSFEWDQFNNLLKKNPEQFYHNVKNLTGSATIKSITAQSNLLSSSRKPRKYVELSSESDFEDEEESEDDKYNRKVSKTGTPRSKRVLYSTPTSERYYNIPSFPQVSSKKLNLEGLQDDEEEQAKPMAKLFSNAKKRLHTGAHLNTLPCRDQQFEQLYTSVEVAIENNTGMCIYVSGTPGTGKTVTIREVIKQLAEKHGSVFDYLEINGLKLLTPQAAYEVLFSKIFGQRSKSGQAVGLLEDHFNSSQKKKPLVVLMDELDQILTKNQSVLYNFFNWPSYSSSSLIVIAVANTMDLPERLLTNKISSRLGMIRLQFPGYNFSQLAEIIKHRLESIGKLNSDKLVINSGAIEFASRKVASVSGDARRALSICLRAVEIAEKEFKKKTEEEKAELGGIFTVQIAHIIKSVNESTSSTVTSYLNCSPFHLRLFLVGVLARIRRTGVTENTLGSIIDELQNMIKVNHFQKVRESLERENLQFTQVIFGGLKTRMQSFDFILQELIENGIILKNGNLGRSSLIKLNIEEDEITTVFKKDDTLKEVMY
ncbi:BA75_04810T0 [Komagataella pastoris]|uniref:Origin recognition complex subunit 1 n=1 Tax=Komagataella pastoris TaxID=4922 RepID=A0A1B2JJA2_PICPA|nr:BA75_04810T0 [Komagataella pastoris]